MRNKRGSDRGATMVEAAIAYSLLFLALFAVVEFGMAFKDWLSVSHAARDGARAGATFGNAPSADIHILHEIEGTLSSVGLQAGDDVRIFRANSPGAGYSTLYQYAPGTGCDIDPLYSGPPLPGCCDWTPCPEIGRDTYTEPIWEPSCRDVSAPDTDRIGVEIAFTHEWLTGFFADSTDFTPVTDFQLEPQVFDESTPSCT